MAALITQGFKTPNKIITKGLTLQQVVLGTATKIIDLFVKQYNEITNLFVTR